MSHGSGEEENYWPGYVDALTSMVQVLAFVMMLLAMAVFVLSQNVSKSAVQAIAKAAKMDVPKDANVAQLTNLVIEELDRLKSKPPASSEAEPKPEPAKDVGKTPGADTANPVAATAGGPKPDSARGEGAKPDPAVASKPAEGLKADIAKADGPKPDPAKGEGAKPDAAKADGVKADTPKPDSTKTQSAAAAGDVPAAPAPIAPAAGIRSASAAKPIPQPPDGKFAMLHFAARGFKVEAADDATLGKFLDDGHLVDANARLVIRAYAAASDGALTEARRLAYYRAMSARKALTERKVQTGNIRIVILDTQDNAQGSTADVFADESAKK